MTFGNWIKLYRDIATDEAWRAMSDGQKVGFVGLLLSVCYESYIFTCPRCGDTMKIPAGGTSKSAKEIAGFIDTSPKSVRNMIQKLIRSGTIRAQGRARCHSIYVLVNWEKYQCLDEVPGTGMKQGGHKSGTDRAQKVKNKEIRIKKEEPPQLSFDREPEQDFSHVEPLVALLEQSMDIIFPNRTPTPEKQRAGWLLELDRMHRRDGRDGISLERMSAVLEWLPTHMGSDGFRWGEQIRSASNFRKKFERLEAAMNRPGGKKQQRMDIPTKAEDYDNPLF